MDPQIICTAPVKASGTYSGYKHHKCRCYSCKVAGTNYKRDYRKRNPENVVTKKRWHFRTRYGITLEEYNRLLEEQAGICAMCGGPPNGRSKTYFHVDHYDTPEGPVVRGLLCHNCNLGIGFLKHDSGRLQAAINYLEGT